MSKNWIAPYKAADGCVYFLNAKTGKIQKTSDVERREEMPPDALAHFGNLAAVFDEMWYRFKPPPQPLTEAELDVLREGLNQAFNEAMEKEKGRGNG